MMFPVIVALTLVCFQFVQILGHEEDKRGEGETMQHYAARHVRGAVVSNPVKSNICLL
jgi:hypothetical protein